MNAVFYLVFCRLQSRKFHNLISIAVISVCVAILMLATSISSGFEKVILAKITVAMPHIMVFDNEQKVNIQNIKGINKTLKLAQVQALLLNEHNEQVQGVLLRSDNIKDSPETSSHKRFLKTGKYPKSGEIIIGNKLVESMQVDIGDEVKLLTGPTVFKTFKISGIFQVGLYDFDSSVVLAPFSDIVDLKADPQEGIASDIKIFDALWLNNPMEARKISQEIQTLNPKFFVINWQNENQTLVNAIKLEKTVIFIVLLFLVTVVAIAIGNSLFIQILNQKQHIAIFSAIGMTSRQIMYVYVIESVITATIGCSIALLIALASIYFLVHYPISLPMDVYQVETLPVSCNYSDIILILILSTVITCIPSMLPALYAAKLDPIEILRKYN